MADARTVNAFFSLELPPRLVDALVETQRKERNRIEPQQRDQIHITLGFVHDADGARLADAAAVLSGRDWPAPEIALTGEVRHGSWELQKDPAYHYRDDVVQRREQVRLGVRQSGELTEVYDTITGRLGIAEGSFWPHVTLGLARENLPASEAAALDVPSEKGPAASLDLRQEVSATEFRVLVRRRFGPSGEKRA